MSLTFDDTVSVILMIIAIAAAGLALVGVIALWMRVNTLDDREDILEGCVRKLAGASVPTEDAMGVSATMALPDPMRLLAQPPQIATPDGMRVVGDWLTHYSIKGTTWPGVVAEVYRRLLLDREIAALFTYDEHRIVGIKRHFTAMMIKFMKHGIRAKDVEDLRKYYRNVTITGAIFDRTIATVAQVLADAGVPGTAISDLARMLTEAKIREVLVSDERAVVTR